jgi:hypothetical protein
MFCGEIEELNLYAVGSSPFQTCFDGGKNFVLRHLVYNGTRFLRFYGSLCKKASLFMMTLK